MSTETKDPLVYLMEPMCHGNGGWAGSTEIAQMPLSLALTMNPSFYSIQEKSHGHRLYICRTANCNNSVYHWDDEGSRWIKDPEPKPPKPRKATQTQLAKEFGACIVTCPKCDGKKGFEDTTYNRTGEWCSCEKCSGRGTIVDEKKFFALHARITKAQPLPPTNTTP